MRTLPCLFVAALLATPSRGALAADDGPLAGLCGTNPAFSESIMRAVLQAQLQKDHDPSLDTESPDKLAQQAVGQGISDCVDDLRRDPQTYAVLAPLGHDELDIGWDAYNTACSDRHGSKADCIKAEIGSVRALKRMSAADSPPGARALVQVCELVLQPDPPMADWRQCVDQGLSAHASPDRAASCKLSVTYHSARTGAEAGRIVGACLGAK